LDEKRLFEITPPSEEGANAGAVPAELRLAPPGLIEVNARLGTILAAEEMIESRLRVGERLLRLALISRLLCRRLVGRRRRALIFRISVSHS
jgi:hypothetical protein